MGGDNEVQRTMLELINQLDGFDPRGNIKASLYNILTIIVLNMATVDITKVRHFRQL